MALQARLFGSWDLLSADFADNPGNPYACRWYLALIWTPYRWAQWISGPSVRRAYVPCWAEGDHFGEFLWEYDGAPLAPSLAGLLRNHLSVIAAQREAKLKTTAKLPSL